MQFFSWLKDKKVNGLNVSAEISIGEYWDVAEQILENNEFQRRRVSTRGKPYQLLQRDLISGCIIPPIILSLRQTDESIMSDLMASEESRPSDEHKQQLEQNIKREFNDAKLLILDGLQRTFTIGDCITELASDTNALETFRQKRIRLEIYLGLNKMGILYRMLTLNTGQTPMTLRQQIEMLYRDYLDPDTLPDGITVIREADERRARGDKKYKFSDVVDMFYAYSTGKPESMDKQTLVTKLSEMEFLEEFNPSGDELQALLVTYNRLVQTINNKSKMWEFDQTGLLSSVSTESVERPFGKNVSSVFERVQPMTAFGSECKRLIRQGNFASIAEIDSVIRKCEFGGEPQESLDLLVFNLDEISKRASKIGTAQRDLFQYSFRALLNPDSDAFKNLSQCWESGKSRYDSLS